MSARSHRAQLMGRIELLNFVNNFLETDYTKIEHLADGIAYCQLIDAVFPGKVPLHKLNFNPQYTDENTKNLRVLTDSLKRLKIDKDVPVERVAQGKFQDNNEFLQWAVQFVQNNYALVEEAYHPQARREEAIAKAARLRKGSTSSWGGGGGGRGKSRTNSNLFPNNAGLKVSPRLRPRPDLHLNREGQPPPSQGHSGEEGVGHMSSERILQAKKRREEMDDLIELLESELTERYQKQEHILADITGLRREREFYFDKLKCVEDMCERWDENYPTRLVLESIIHETTSDFVVDE